MIGPPRPLVAQLHSLQPQEQLIGAELLPWQHLPDHTVHPRLHEGRLCGRVIRGIFFPPILLQAQQAHGYVVMPP